MSSANEPPDADRGTDWRKGAVLVGLLVAYQLALHFAVSTDPGSGLGELLTIGPMAVAAVWFCGRTWRGRLLIVVPVVIAVAGWIAWRAAGADPSIVYLLSHVGTYLFLLWFFGHTLAPGSRPLVTRLAQMVHGTLPGPIEGYTRRVTAAWCVFFAGMALASLLLYQFASLAAWSVFANLLSLPLVVAMFLGEYAYRLQRFPDFSHSSIRDMIHAIRKHGSGQTPGA